MTKQNNTGKEQSYDVVIVGAGAAGVGCGIVLQDLGVKRFTILERHEIGASFFRWPAETRLLTPSFTINGFGMPDLNSIALQTSPAYTLNTEHPTGIEYSLYLHAVAEHWKLPVKTGVNVDYVDPYPDQDGFRLATNEGDIHTRFLIWAAGEFQYPRQNPFPGADLCRHYATIDSWKELDLPVDEAVVIGGYESGVDSAIHLANEGLEVTIIDPEQPWNETAPDPSLSLSPYTKSRLRKANRNDLISFIQEAVMRVEAVDDEYVVHLYSGEKITTGQPPFLATGFRGSLTQISHLFEWGEHGSPIVTEEADESTITPGLFLSGPMLRHGNVIFCFIYKFRQRFAVIGSAIAEELGLETAAVLERYRQAQMYLDDLSCCDVNCAC